MLYEMKRNCNDFECVRKPTESQFSLTHCIWCIHFTLSTIYAPLHFVCMANESNFELCVSRDLQPGAVTTRPTSWWLFLSARCLHALCHSNVDSLCIVNVFGWKQRITEVCLSNSVTALFRKSLKVPKAKQKQQHSLNQNSAIQTTIKRITKKRNVPLRS